jgi:hypothetical protein
MVQGNMRPGSQAIPPTIKQKVQSGNNLKYYYSVEALRYDEEKWPNNLMLFARQHALLAVWMLRPGAGIEVAKNAHVNGRRTSAFLPP